MLTGGSSSCRKDGAPDRRTTAGSHPHLTASQWNNRGIQFVDEGDNRRAVACFHRALTTSVQELDGMRPSPGADNAAAIPVPPSAGASVVNHRAAPPSRPHTNRGQYSGDETEEDNGPQSVDDIILRWSCRKDRMAAPTAPTSTPPSMAASSGGAYISNSNAQEWIPIFATPLELMTSSSSQDERGRLGPHRCARCESMRQSTLDTAIIVFNVACNYHDQGLKSSKSGMLYKAGRMYEKTLELITNYYNSSSSAAATSYHGAGGCEWCSERQQQQHLPPRSPSDAHFFHGVYKEEEEDEQQHKQQLHNEGTSSSSATNRNTPLFDLLVMMTWNNMVQLNLYFGDFDKAEANLCILTTFVMSMDTFSSQQLLSGKSIAILERQRSSILINRALLRFPPLAAAA